MATISELYEMGDLSADGYVEVPAWIEDDITCADIAAICEGGCASGAYMPAVTYHKALQTMSDHGDDVLQYIDDVGCGISGGDLVGEGSWAGMACYLLSMAVELWASSAAEEIDPETEAA